MLTVKMHGSALRAVFVLGNAFVFAVVGAVNSQDDQTQGQRVAALRVHVYAVLAEVGIHSFAVLEKVGGV